MQYFNQVIDKSLETLKPRIVQLKKYRNLFGFLCSFQNLSKDITKKCTDPEMSLTELKFAQTKNYKVKTIKLADIGRYMF